MNLPLPYDESYLRLIIIDLSMFNEDPVLSVEECEFEELAIGSYVDISKIDYSSLKHSSQYELELPKLPEWLLPHSPKYSSDVSFQNSIGSPSQFKLLKVTLNYWYLSTYFPIQLEITHTAKPRQSAYTFSSSLITSPDFTTRIVTVEPLPLSFFGFPESKNICKSNVTFELCHPYLTCKDDLGTVTWMKVDCSDSDAMAYPTASVESGILRQIYALSLAPPNDPPEDFNWMRINEYIAVDITNCLGELFSGFCTNLREKIDFYVLKQHYLTDEDPSFLSKYLEYECIFYTKLFDLFIDPLLRLHPAKPTDYSAQLATPFTFEDPLLGVVDDQNQLTLAQLISALVILQRFFKAPPTVFTKRQLTDLRELAIRVRFSIHDLFSEEFLESKQVKPVLSKILEEFRIEIDKLQQEWSSEETLSQIKTAEKKGMVWRSNDSLYYINFVQKFESRLVERHVPTTMQIDICTKEILCQNIGIGHSVDLYKCKDYLIYMGEQYYPKSLTLHFRKWKPLKDHRIPGRSTILDEFNVTDLDNTCEYFLQDKLPFHLESCMGRGAMDTNNPVFIYSTSSDHNSADQSYYFVRIVRLPSTSTFAVKKRGEGNIGTEHWRWTFKLRADHPRLTEPSLNSVQWISENNIALIDSYSNSVSICLGSSRTSTPIVSVITISEIMAAARIKADKEATLVNLQTLDCSIKDHLIGVASIGINSSNEWPNNQQTFKTVVFICRLDDKSIKLVNAKEVKFIIKLIEQTELSEGGGRRRFQGVLLNSEINLSQVSLVDFTSKAKSRRCIFALVYPSDETCTVQYPVVAVSPRTLAISTIFYHSIRLPINDTFTGAYFGRMGNLYSMNVVRDVDEDGKDKDDQIIVTKYALI